jgi:DNA invertase Pin-like site-specific DNA recombinase
MNGRQQIVPRPRKLCCAIYTRKSSEEGLEQSFNSLHAQREACEAFINSQKHEGWVILPTPYDDGGLSGGSMQRPALQKLLENVRNRLVDVVVVYKVDRLTRSLADFAKLTELFDAHETSFVSVTQQFNTSTSMGRLTLNVLLSFAQFEREVAGERIRDKIALSKRRGMWMGGLPPLGYDGVNGELVVNEAEAETVRFVFREYMATGSIADLKRSLDGAGVVSKRRRFSDGREVGGVPLSRGALYQILRNRLYRGEIAHRGEVHRGNHQPILDADLWSSVQEKLTGQSGRKRGVRSGASQSALLADLAFDGAGNRLTPTYAVKAGRRYCYYVSAPLIRGEHSAHGIRVPASDLEQLVIQTITGHLRNPTWVLQQLGSQLDMAQMQRLLQAAAGLAGAPVDGKQTSPTEIVGRLIARITLDGRQLTIELNQAMLLDLLSELDQTLAIPSPSDRPLTISIEVHALRCGKQVRLVVGEIHSVTRSPHPALIKLVTDAHRWFEDLRSGRAESIAAIAERDRQQVSHVSRTLGLAFLAPDILEVILSGRQPITFTPERLKACRPLPLNWNEQRAILLG